MLTLLEASKMIQDPLQKGVVEIYPRVSPVLERLPFLTVGGMAYKYSEEKTLPGVGWRGINENYTESTGVLNPRVEPLFIGGGLSKVDRALLKVQGAGNNLRATYDAMKVKAFSLAFTNKFFNGNNAVDNKSFDGLKTRLVGNQVLDMGSSDGGDTLTLAKLDELLDAVVGGADALFMNKTLRRKVSALVRASNAAIETVNDAFGRQLTAYAGVPIAVLEEDNEGNEILGFSEPDLDDGDKEVTASIYACRFGAGEYVSGIQASEMEVKDLGLIPGTVYYCTDVEWISSIAVFNSRSAARLRGIKNA